MSTENPQAKVHSTLARASARAFGLATGLILGIGLLVATLALLPGDDPNKGQHLGRLGQIFPGYRVSVLGSLIGFVYAFVIGYALGRLLAPRAPQSLARAQRERGKHVRLNAGGWAMTTGGLCALVLFAATTALALRGGEHVGELLQQVEIYFPGYSVTMTGAVIGAAYAFGAGWVLGKLIVAVYNRTVESAERSLARRAS